MLELVLAAVLITVCLALGMFVVGFILHVREERQAKEAVRRWMDGEGED